MDAKKDGFTKGLTAVRNKCTAAEYERCKEEAKEVCLTTEVRYNSRGSYYRKMKGLTPLTVAEEERMDKVFAKFGVTDWRGTDEKEEPAF